MLSYVVAISQNNVIGKEQGLPWHLPDDAKFFKEVTLSQSKTMIMGRKTFESLPKVLPGRKHIIITRNEDYQVNDENVEILHNLDELKPMIEAPEEYFVIGGAKIFNLLFPYVEKMYLTEIHEDFPGDTFFPSYDRGEWKVIEQKEGTVDEKNHYKHTFFILEKIK